MEIFQGTATFPGIAIGIVKVYYRNPRRNEQNIAEDIQEELKLFQRVVQMGKQRLQKLCSQEQGEVLQEYQEQRALLNSPSFLSAVQGMISSEKVTTGHALEVTREELTANFGTLETPAVRRRIQNIRKLTNLLQSVGEPLFRKKFLAGSPAILVAESLSPKDVLEIEKENLLAVVTRIGSNVAHTAIMAKNLDIPVLVDVDVSSDWDGREVIVDGYSGTLYVDPEPELKRECELRREAQRQEQELLLALRDAKDVTLDGKEVKVLANIGSLDDLSSVKYYGAAGIGLIRSEFQYLERETYPREQELFLAYKKVAEFMKEKQAVIRTVDLGADKLSPYLDIPSEANPIMGNRGIRLCLDRHHMFRAQLRAIYRASAYGNLAILYPMITSVEEIRQIKALVQDVTDGLKAKDIPYDEHMPVGIMIETPAAVMISGELAREVDFLSLGTNDLTQYTLAMDRQNPALKGKYNDHHPAVLKMIEMVIKEGHRAGCQVTICGELAADTSLTERFLKMGVDALSVVPACILPIRKAIRESSTQEEISKESKEFYGNEK